MRRTDRLLGIVQLMRGGRLVTALRLAERLEVSERTIYRDISDLQTSGVPIEGEAGVGYVMRAGYDLPPLMFTQDEVVALVAGARMVRGWGGAAMARAAEEALVKIEAVLPESARERVAQTAIFAPEMEMTYALRERLDAVESATRRRTVLTIVYGDGGGVETRRSVQPLGLWFWGKVWTLVAWCELRDDFRMFRLDRIAHMVAEDRVFRNLPERSLAEALRRQEAEARCPE